MEKTNYNFDWLPAGMAGTDVLLGEENLQSILMIKNVSAFVNFKYFNIFGTFDEPVSKRICYQSQQEQQQRRT